jgi:hypothetical protein
VNNDSIPFRQIFDQKVPEELANKACLKTLAMATHTFKVLLFLIIFLLNPNLNESLLILLIAFLFPVVLFCTK